MQINSYMAEMQISQREWCPNGLRYATAAEAEASGAELMSRWMVPIGYRAAPTEDAVNCRFDLAKGRNVYFTEEERAAAITAITPLAIAA